MTIPTYKPYAAKAIIEHLFDTDHLDIFVTFRFPMNETLKPDHDLWVCEVNEAEKAVTASAWQDAWTLLLTVPDVAVLPDKVTLEFLGPTVDLSITWNKQWEPWGPIVSIEIPPVYTTRTFTTGPGVQDNVDIANINILFIDATSNAITIAGFINGVNGQVLHIAKTDESANSVTLQDHAGTSTQDIHLHAEANETLTSEHGGWSLVCDGSGWFDCSHAKHV